MPLTPQQTQTTTDALWRRWRDLGDVDARRELLGRYLGLVHHAAREVAPRVRDAVSLDELVSAGSLGLMQAMQGFDIDRGLAFSTFAMRRIRGAILDELRARDPLSRADRAHVRRLDSAVAQLEQKGGRAPTPTEVAEHLGVDDETLQTVVCWRTKWATTARPFTQRWSFRSVAAQFKPRSTRSPPASAWSSRGPTSRNGRSAKSPPSSALPNHACVSCGHRRWRG
jgi:hypothetical protein